MQRRTLRQCVLTAAVAGALGVAATARADLVYTLEVDGTGAATATMAAGDTLTVDLYANMTNAGNPGFLIGGGSLLATGGIGTGAISSAALATGLNGLGSGIGVAADLNGDGFADWGSNDATNGSAFFYASANQSNPAQPAAGSKVLLGTFTFHLSTFTSAGSVALSFVPRSQGGVVNHIWYENYDPTQTTTPPLYNALDNTIATVSAGTGVTVSFAANEWKNVTSGDFSSGANWTGATPPGAADTANFLNQPTAAASVRLTAPATVGGLTFNNTHGYTIYTQNASKLTVSHAGGATVSVQAGAHEISAPVALGSDATVDVAAGSQLTVSGPIDAGTTTLSKTGSGTLAVSRVQGQTLAITSGTVQLLAGGGAANVSTLGGLTVAGGRLDVTNNDLIIHNADAATVGQMIQSGYANGTWGGTGIVSSLAGSAGFLGSMQAMAGTFDGVSVTASDVLVRLTLRGDTNLDGTVNFGDLLVLAQHYSRSGTWATGDFNGDGTVNFADLLVLAQNYNRSYLPDTAAFAPSFQLDVRRAFAAVAIPEPASLGLMALGAVGLLGRRRR